MPSNLLVAYATTDGMTAKIAERIADVVRTLGWSADVADTAKLSTDLDPKRYDAIHAQYYQRSASRFVKRHLGVLRSRPSGFFSVCLAIRSKDERERTKARQIAEQFAARLGWKPDVIETMAGALMFSRYGWLRRAVMKRVAMKEAEPVEITRDTIYTDWDAVARFARDFVARAAKPRAIAPETPAGLGARGT